MSFTGPQREAFAKHLAWLCGSFHHRSNLRMLKNLALRVGVALPPDSVSVTREWLCARIARQLHHPNVTTIPTNTTAVDAQRSGTCHLQLLRPVTEDSLGSFGLVYIVRGYNGCVSSLSPGAPQAPDDVVAIKTSWAKYDVDIEEFPMYLCKILTEHYVMYQLNVVHGGHFNICKMYGSWAGPHSNQLNVLPQMSVTPWIATKYYDAGQLFAWALRNVKLHSVFEQPGGARVVGAYSLPVKSAVSLACSILVQLARGLDFIHQCQFVHGDFKAENCLVSIKNADSNILEYATGAKLWPDVAIADFDASCKIHTDDAHGPRTYPSHAEMNLLRTSLGLPARTMPAHVIMSATEHIVTRAFNVFDLSQSTIPIDKYGVVVRAALQRLNLLDLATRWCYDQAYQGQVFPRLANKCGNLACSGNTAVYAAPEFEQSPLYGCIIKTPDQDAWSLGASMFTLMTGKRIDAANMERRGGGVESIMRANCLLAQEESAPLRRAINSLLRIEPSARATAGVIARDVELISRAAQCWTLCGTTLFDTGDDLQLRSRDQKNDHDHDDDGARAPPTRRRRLGGHTHHAGTGAGAGAGAVGAAPAPARKGAEERKD